MNKSNILSGTLFQREVSDNNFLGMGLIQLDFPVQEKMFYIFDKETLSLTQTDISLSKEEQATYKSSCISGIFTSVEFVDFPEYERFSSCLLIPIENDIYFFVTIKRNNTIFYSQSGDSFYTINNNSIIPCDKDIKTLGDTVLSIARKPLWSAGNFDNISFQGFTTEAFKHYKICQNAFDDFAKDKISEEEFVIINHDNHNFITGYNDSHYMECIKSILKKESNFLTNHSFYFSYIESIKRSNLIKQSLEETMK